MMFGLFKKKEVKINNTAASTDKSFYERLPPDTKKYIEESFDSALLPTIEMLQDRIGRTLVFNDPNDVHLLFKDIMLLKRGLVLDAEDHGDKQGFVLYTASYEYTLIKYIGYMKALFAEPNIDDVLPDDRGARLVLGEAKESGEYKY